MERQRETAAQGRLIPIWTGIFVGVLVLVPSLSSKFISVGPFIFAGAILIFPITYIFNDLLTEVYGYRRSRMVIWTGMVMELFAALIYWIVDVWPAPTFWTNQASYHAILGQAPRIALASPIAYFCGEFANSVILSKLKFFQGGARGLRLATRFVLSTVVGEAVDSFLFISIAFFGLMPNDKLFTTIFSIWIFKVLYEVVTLPISMPLSNWVKKLEGMDVIDNPKTTNYNPFSLKMDEAKS